ncbi:glycerophosphodiester phosphodiesterase family protein [Sutterella sp.]|uniref:glycerophosphodiester phosphodiesterase family protein n=1 Tax=Sutterella sp. TaxID=1981025 RepID=UPI003FD6C047
MSLPETRPQPALRPWPFVRLVAHRGGGTLGPENTLEGYRQGLRHGYRAIETDVMLTKDGVPVMMHDEKFGRVIRGDARSVPEVTAEELLEMDAGGWLSPFWYGVSAPLLTTALRWCRRNRVWMNLEIKPARGHASETGRIAAETVARGYEDVVRAGGDAPEGIVPEAPLLSSYSREALAAARLAAPDLPRALLVDDVPADWREACAELGCVSLNIDYRTATPEFVSAVHAAGLWVFAYTPNDPDEVAALLRMGVDALCTDRIDRIAPVF